MNRFLGGIALSALLATPAFSADMPLKAAPPTAIATVYNWSGFYVGGHVGYGWGDVDATVVTTNGTAFPVGTALATTSMKGILAGGQVGYNFQISQFVLGIEAEGSLSSIDGSSRSYSTVNSGLLR